jgi:hypothetical protein
MESKQDPNVAPLGKTIVCFNGAIRLLTGVTAGADHDPLTP